MKYISFIIPCFNSSEYMRHCIESCMLSEDVEVLIIDDGSKKDNTYDIAKEYQDKYPKICRAIHKENGGHGSVVNMGIKEAKGLFIKIVDSDDWIDTSVGNMILNNIKIMVEKNNIPDLIVSNYVYDKVGQEHKKVMKYTGTLPSNEIVTWDDINDFKIGNYLLMHSLMYRTQILRDCNLILPEHTFYVDNIFAYYPLSYVKTLIYYDDILYHYYIGREDQSVNEEVMKSRLDQQYRVTYYMLDNVDLTKVESKKLRKYMMNYILIIMAVSSILSIRTHDPKWYGEKEKLWDYVKNQYPDLYRKIYYSIIGIGVNLPTDIGRSIASLVYDIADNIVGFN